MSEAVSRYQAAAALCPSYAPALYNLGVVAGELKQADAALAYYTAAIAAEPRYAQAGRWGVPAGLGRARGAPLRPSA